LMRLRVTAGPQALETMAAMRREEPDV
jgi:hypothetical protein